MAIETSLASQLKALAVPQTSLLFLHDKVKPSLLFSPSDAASYDRETFFAYGSTGLDKLKLIDSKFIPFGENLFSESWKTLERSVQTAEINEKLDKAVTKFLRLLSPYFLLRAAHEALEWLIHRFHVHLFNVDELVGCILPHHNTRIFVRVLQLLNLSNPAGHWHWLLPMQKSGTPLEASVIINRFNVDGNFRSFVCSLIPNILEVYDDQDNAVEKIISFSTLTVYNALQSSAKITNNLIAVLLSYITSGLRSRILSFCAGTYMIICSLVVKAKMTSDILEELLLLISKNIVPSLRKQGLEILVLIFQYQDMESLPKQVFTSLLDDDVLADMQYICEKYRCTKLKRSFLKRAIPLAFKREISRKSPKKGKVMHFTEDLLNCLTLEKSDVCLSLRLILNLHTKMHAQLRQNEEALKTLKKIGSSLLKCLEVRWADYFDCALESYFKKHLDKKSKVARDLVNHSVTTLKHEMVPYSTVTLFVGINHHVDVVRSGAVDVFLHRISKNEHLDVEFVESSLMARLNDDSPEIVLKILSAKKVFLDFFSEEELLDSLSRVLNKNHKENGNWDLVKEEALRIFCNIWQPNADNNLRWKLLSIILPFLLPWRYEAFKYVMIVLNSQLGDHHPIVHSIKEACLPDIMAMKQSDHEIVVLKIVQSLLTAVSLTEPETMVDMIHFLIERNHGEGCSYKFILILILQHVISFQNDHEITLQTKYILKEAFKLCSLLSSSELLSAECKVPDDLKETVIASSKILRKRKFPLPVIFYSLQSIIKALKLECNSSENQWWPNPLETPDQFLNYQTSLEMFEFLNGCINKPNGFGVSGFKTLLGVMIRHHFANHRKLFWFLSSLWGNYGKNQMTAIKVCEGICRVPSDLSWIFDKASVEIPSLMIAIASEDEHVRSCALHLLKSILALSEKCSLPLRSLAVEICNHEADIVMDSRQLYQVIDHWLAPGYSPKSAAKDQVGVFKWLQNLVTDLKTPTQIRHAALLSLQFVDSEEVLTTFLSVTKMYLNKYKESLLPSSPLDVAIIQLLLNKITIKTACLLIDENSEVLEVLSLALQLTVQRADVLDVTVHEIALQRITKNFFISIPSTAVQQKILGILMDLYLNAGSPDMSFKIGKALRKLCVYASLLLKELCGFEFPSLKKTVREIKKSRTSLLSLTSETDVLESMSWKKVIIILEIIQDKKKIEEKEILIPELFSLLNKTLEWENQPSVEYVRQLILASIFNCLGDIYLDERKFRVELIIQCIRVSDNAKTHHQALLLLNLAAAMFPDYVLNNIMSIFTFMGSSILRHDDSYSFQVISQTIETVVPALLQASHQQKESDSIQVISTVIRVFVDSLLDIPRHRQLPLFTKLIETLGASDYLWLPLAQVCDCFVSKKDISASEFVKGVEDLSNNPYFEFILNLYQQFIPAIQINACTHIIKFLTTLPDSKDEKIKRPQSQTAAEKVTHKEPFDVSSHTNFQLQMYKFTALSALNELLSSQAFVGQISELHNKSITNMESHYEELLEVTLQYLQLMTQALQVKQSKSLLLKIYNLLNNVNSLLPCILFIAVTRKLLNSPTSLVRRKTLEMLNAKLECQQSFFRPDNYDNLLELLRPLLKIVKSPQDDSGEVASDDILQNRQNALVSIHLLGKIIGKEYPQKFYKVLHVVVKILQGDSSQTVFGINALVLLAYLCSILKKDAVPSLNLFMPHVVHMLENFTELKSNECLAMGAVTALKCLVEHLGIFLSGYVQPILKQICLLKSVYSKSKNSLQMKLDKVCQLVSSEITPRVLIPAVTKSYHEMLVEDKSAICSLMSILGDRVSDINLLDLHAHSSEIEELYLLALDFRCSHPMEPSPSIETVEDSIILSLTIFVKKLPESSFRSLFNVIYQWATKSEGKQDRVLTLYRLTHKLSDELKSLFVLFAAHFYRNAASLLESNNVMKTDEPFFGNDESSTSKSCQLINHILDTLRNCFLYDSNEFIDKNSFNVLMQPIVDQIENELGDDESYQNRVENHLKTCLGLLAVAVSDHTLRKSLNYQILLKSRHSSPKVRFAALEVIGEVVKKMNSEYLVLLPESIPFLSELMEDDSLEVEQQCQKVIANMEKVLGEPISKYF